MNMSLIIVVAFIVIVLGVFGAFFKNDINSRRNWIDICVIEQWESTGERHVGARDYCLAKYRQT